MSHAPEFLFSHRFPGIIWNTVAVESENRLVLEARDEVNFNVTFSQLDFVRNEFSWKDVSVSERWWVNLIAANESTVLLNRFMNKGGNPDLKSLIAVDTATGKVRWEREQLSFNDWNTTAVFAYRTQEELTQVEIDLFTGDVSEKPWKPEPPSIHVETLKPVFYAEGTPHFETVKKFVAGADYQITKGVEYLEFNDWILISVYIEESGKLANYLLVFSAAGSLVLTLKLGENLGGLGADTFFLLAGCLFLVQNKTDLVAYRL